MEQPRPAPDRSRQWMLYALLAGFAVASASILLLVDAQAPGADFSCFWAGAETALQSPAQIYDFEHVTALQGWPLGPGALRPYIYPPSALLLFVPFTAPPYWAGYGLWVVLTGLIFVAAAVKARLPWWFVLLPSIAFVAYCGQVTFLIGGLVLGGLALSPRRPLLAGVLFGVAAAVKPQMLVLLPFALAAQGQWRTMLASAATGLVMVGASALIWGADAWIDWLSALSRFQRVIFDNPELVADAITPYAALQRWGAPPGLAFILVPFAVFAAWTVFRRDAPLEDRLLAVLGGAILVSPYAMNYELALLAPAVAAYLARTDDRRWFGYVLAACLYAVAPPAVGLIAALALPAIRRAGRRPDQTIAG